MVGVCLAFRACQQVGRIRERGIYCTRQYGALLATGSTHQLTYRYYCRGPSEPASPQQFSVLPELTLYTKTPCPLCDEALETLAPALHRVSLRKVDITLPENRRWYKLYRYDIPVFHFNNAFLMKHRGDLSALLGALKTWEAPKA